MKRPLRILFALPVAVMTLQAQSCKPHYNATLIRAGLPGEVSRPQVKLYEYRGEKYVFLGKKVARKKGVGWEIPYDPAFRLTEAVINEGRHVGNIARVDVKMVTYEQVPRLKPGAGVVRNPYLEAIEENQGGE